MEGDTLEDKSKFADTLPGMTKWITPKTALHFGSHKYARFCNITYLRVVRVVLQAQITGVILRSLSGVSPCEEALTEGVGTVQGGELTEVHLQ